MPMTHDAMAAFIHGYTDERAEINASYGFGPLQYPLPGFDLEASKAVAEEIIALAVSPLPLGLTYINVSDYDYDKVVHMPDPIRCRDPQHHRKYHCPHCLRGETTGQAEAKGQAK